MRRGNYLTKSRYAAGLQCSRRLWLDVHEPESMETDGDAADGAPGDISAEIGLSARLLFPGGVLVEEKPWEHAAAVVRTRSLMADKSVPAIFEAAFEHANVRIRVDVLERLPRGCWGLREVKSSGAVKEPHHDDVAVQLHVLKSCGLRVPSAQVLHVNVDYKLGLKGIAWPRFFRRPEVKDDVRARLKGIEARLAAQRALLSRPRPPSIEPDTHCHDPYPCDHWDRCTATKAADWVYYLPNLKETRRAELKDLGIESISAIPDDFHLSARQEVIRDATRSGTPYVAPDLAKRLAGFGPPALYLDFEAFMPAIPLYPGTRPYQTLPFQWSLHCAARDGTTRHEEFLADAAGDPRRPFAESLVAALQGTKLPIIVYSPYEEMRLNELAAALPDLAKPIKGIVARLKDLLPVVRGGVYHPGFAFSNSIKTAAPALCRDVTYRDLEDIADGGSASTAFWRMASGRTDAATSERLRRSLRAYCQRDTWAMVRLHQALNALAAAHSRNPKRSEG